MGKPTNLHQVVYFCQLLLLLRTCVSFVGGTGYISAVSMKLSP
jgi:hypothetical protein